MRLCWRGRGNGIYSRLASARASTTSPFHYHINRAVPGYSNFISPMGWRIGVGRRCRPITLSLEETWAPKPGWTHRHQQYLISAAMILLRRPNRPYKVRQLHPCRSLVHTIVYWEAVEPVGSKRADLRFGGCGDMGVWGTFWRDPFALISALIVDLSTRL